MFGTLKNSTEKKGIISPQRRREMIKENELSSKIIGAAIEIHRILGPGLLESTYEECLCRELNLNGLSFERQKSLPIKYKGIYLDCGYRLDLVVENCVIVELKSVETCSQFIKLSF